MPENLNVRSRSPPADRPNTFGKQLGAHNLPLDLELVLHEIAAHSGFHQ